MASDHSPATMTIQAHSGLRIAHLGVAGAPPTVVWLGGYRSDMRGTKAEHLSDLAGAKGFAYLRFDYCGHGESEGAFEDGTISSWTQDALAMIDAQAKGPLVLVGSSMGGWIALLLIRALRERGEPKRVRALLLLAPAPDFTHRLVEPGLTPADRASLDRDGFVAEASPYSDQPTIYTRRLLEDGLQSCVMEGPIETGCPVHIIQGMEDPDVPYTHALDLVSLLPADGVTLTLVRDGDHRLSRPEDLLRMERALDDLLEAARMPD